MRAIHLARLDKTRPVLVLTRAAAVPYLTNVTVAPITTRIRGLSSEVEVGVAHGLDRASVITCDNIQTTSTTNLGRLLGYLPDSAEPMLTAAIVAAFELQLTP